MNNQYLSFLQNTFSEAFDSGKQTEKINTILDLTFSHFEEITSILKSYSTSNPIDSVFNFPGDYYKQFLKMYLEMFGLISIDEYRSLIAKYEKLKKEKQSLENNKPTDTKSNINKTVKSQEKTIASLKGELKISKNDLSKEKKAVQKVKKHLVEQTKTITDLEKKLLSTKARPKSTPNKKAGK